MLKYKTGLEPDHIIAINPQHILYIKPQGEWCWIHTVNGEKFLIDEHFNAVLKQVSEANRQG